MRQPPKNPWERHRNEVIRAVEHAPFPLFPLSPSLPQFLYACMQKILLKFWSHDASGEGAMAGSESVRLPSAKSIFSFFVRLRFEPHKRRANSATPLPHSLLPPSSALASRNHFKPSYRAFASVVPESFPLFASPPFAPSLFSSTYTECMQKAQEQCHFEFTAY